MQRVLASRYRPFHGLPVLIKTKAADSDGELYCPPSIPDQDGFVPSSPPWAHARVRVLESDELDSREKIEKAFGRKGYELFAGLSGLMRAFETDDPTMMRAAMELLAKAKGFSTKWVEDATEPRTGDLRLRGAPAVIYRIAALLPDLVNRELYPGRLVIFFHRKRKRFIPGIYCSTYHTAVFVRMLLNWRFGNSDRICPQCGRKVTKPGAVYDTVQCREKYRLARWRARQKEKNK